MDIEFRDVNESFIVGWYELREFLLTMIPALEAAIDSCEEAELAKQDTKLTLILV